MLVVLLATTLSNWAGFGQAPSSQQGPGRAVVHTVLFQFKAQATPAQIQLVLSDIRRLQAVIPGLLSVAGGPNFSSRSHGFTHGVTLRFADRAALAAFYTHPAHQQLVTASLKPLLADLLVLDFEDTGVTP